jgi:hypothetical protein
MISRVLRALPILILTLAAYVISSLALLDYLLRQLSGKSHPDEC